MNKDILKCEASKILEIAEDSSGSEIYMSVKLVLLDTLVNLNGVQYTEDFIHNIAENKQEYLAIPLVCEVNKLESGKTKNLGHKFDKKTGKFGTQMIGSFIDFSTQKNGDVLELIGEARIPKRFEKVCAAIQDLFEAEELKFSYEIMAADYKVENGTKIVDKSDNNKIIGMAVVSNPAVESAKALALVAAIESDLNIEEAEQEGEEMPKLRNENLTCEEMFAETKTYFENAELDLNQIRAKIYSQLKTLFKDNWYNYDIVFMFMNYIVVKDYNQGDYYKITFSAGESEVTVGEPVKVTISFVETAEKEEIDKMTIEQLQAELNIANEKIKDFDAIIAEKDGAIKTKDVEIAEKQEQINTLSASVITKDAEIASMLPIKEEYEKIQLEKAEAEKVEKKEALKTKYSKLLSAEVLAEPEIAQAIEDLNESVLQAKVIQIALEKAEKTVPEKETKKAFITATRITDDISVNGGTLVSKYITIR